MNWRLSDPARADFERILAKSLEQWGERHAETFGAGLLALFARLAAAPGLGRFRPDIAEGVLSVPHRPFLILYRHEAGFVTILRILHGRRDVRAAVEGLED